MSTVCCKICVQDATVFGQATVLGQYNVTFFRCRNCGLIETETPYWLGHAYSSPIANTDIGLLSRNIKDAAITERIILQWFNADGRFLDYGGGYGILTRLMRDSGFDFLRYDTYSPNLFAQGLDGSLSDQYEMITAFEVFEHFADPIRELHALLSCSRNILFTTCLIPDPPPALGEWWYYALESGQHVTFYTRTALSLLADSVGLKYYTFNNVHLFTEREIAPATFSAVVCGFRKYWIFSELFDQKTPRRSLLESDYRNIMSRYVDTVFPPSCDIPK